MSSSFAHCETIHFVFFCHFIAYNIGTLSVYLMIWELEFCTIIWSPQSRFKFHFPNYTENPGNERYGEKAKLQLLCQVGRMKKDAQHCKIEWVAERYWSLALKL